MPDLLGGIEPGKPMVIGVPWYRAEDWPTIKAIMADAKVLHDSYEEWLRSVTELEAELTLAGQAVEHVRIDPSEFPKWCRKHGLRPNGKARARYASEAVANRPWR